MKIIDFIVAVTWPLWIIPAMIFVPLFVTGMVLYQALTDQL